MKQVTRTAKQFLRRLSELHPRKRVGLRTMNEILVSDIGRQDEEYFLVLCYRQQRWSIAPKDLDQLVTFATILGPLPARVHHLNLTWALRLSLS
jgi:hypothetical protein